MVAVSGVTSIDLLTKTKPASEYATMQASVQAVEVLLIQQTIRLRQQHRIKLPDTIIAATSLAHGLPLPIRNPRDFGAVPGLHVLDTHDAGQLPAL